MIFILMVDVLLRQVIFITPLGSSILCLHINAMTRAFINALVVNVQILKGSPFLIDVLLLLITARQVLSLLEKYIRPIFDLYHSVIFSYHEI